MLSRILFLLTFFYAVTASPLFAQTEQKQFFSLSYNPLTMYTIAYNDKSPYLHDKYNTKGVIYEALLGDNGYKAVGYNRYNYGAWELAYKRILNKTLQLNLGLSCELSSKHWDLYDRPDGPRTKRIMDYRINFLPGIDCFVLNRRQTKLYFSGQIGAQWVHRGMEYFSSNERDKQYFAWQFWYVYDQKISDLFSFNLGIGYGTLGVFKLGVAYHF